MSRNFASIRLGFAVLVVIGLGLGTWEGRAVVRAQDKEAAPKAKAPMEGAWKNMGNYNAASGKYEKLPDGIEQTKLITGGRFIWIVVAEGKIVASAGGTYTFKDNVFTEKITFAGTDSQKPLVGKEFAYPLTIENGKWHLKADFKLDEGEMKIDEMWERCP